MSDKFIQGTPPPVMLPAKNYVFKIEEGHYVINLPRKGNYHELAPDFFPEDAGDFNIFDENSKILYMTAVTKVLFALSKYPDLKFNQFFVPYSFKFEEEEVLIVGQVIDMMLPIDKETEEEKKGEESDD